MYLKEYESILTQSKELEIKWSDLCFCVVGFWASDLVFFLHRLALESPFLPLIPMTTVILALKCVSDIFQWKVALKCKIFVLINSHHSLLV